MSKGFWAQQPTVCRSCGGSAQDEEALLHVFHSFEDEESGEGYVHKACFIAHSYRYTPHDIRGAMLLAVWGLDTSDT